MGFSWMSVVVTGDQLLDYVLLYKYISNIYRYVKKVGKALDF